MRNYLYILIFTAVILSCKNDEGSSLPSAEDRKSAAIKELKDNLVNAISGWKLEYRPNPDNGVYLMILDFHDDGTVTIYSDVIDDDGGDFFEQKIHYRIDATLELELILETYGVFHYLFEQRQATFGAEFVFTYLEEENGSLLFESKSDVTDKTLLEFTPAQASDIHLISTALAENLQQYSGLTPQIFGGLAPIQQIVVGDKGFSIFWSIDLLTRTIDVDIAGEGTSLDEVLSINNYVDIDHVTGFSIQNEMIILDEAFSFSINGENIIVSEISLKDFDTETTSFCPSQNQESPVYSGSISGLGSVTVKKSLFSTDGLSFIEMPDTPYSVNALFIFDESGNSLLQNGSIADKFPDASGFVFNYGLDSSEEPSNAVGFIVADESGQRKTYLREFASIIREGNKLMIEMSDMYYYSDTPEVGGEQRLTEITEEIFEGGVVHIFDLPTDDLKVFWLYNPCNQYEIFLVQ